MYTPLGYKHRYEDPSVLTFTFTINGSLSSIITAAWQTLTVSYMLQRIELIRIIYYTGTLLYLRQLLTNGIRIILFYTQTAG